LRDVEGDAPRPARSQVKTKRRQKPKPENQEAQRLLWLYRGAVHEKRGITVRVTMKKDTARVALTLAKARPSVENEAIILSFAKAPPRAKGSEVSLNVGALCGFAETAAASPAYREALSHLKTDDGRTTVERLVELGRSLGEGITS
jgi:hypothetical protein